MEIELNICFECGSGGDIDNHHVVPKSLGGTKTIPLCLKCHGLVHDRDFIKYRKLHKIGVEKAVAEGKYIGRKVGSGKNPKEFLKQEKSKLIIECLNKGMSYRRIVKELSCSLGTVQKVKKCLKIVNSRLYN
jgi:hypothetical protein